MAKRKLTAKQEKFIEEYLVDLNATAAARRAGYSEKRASEIGYQLLRKTTVQEAISQRRQELAKNTITPEQVIAEYEKIARADIKDFLSFETKKVFAGYDKETGESLSEYRQVVEVRPSSEVDGTLINEVSISDRGTLKFKLHDKMAALEKIGKHLGMWVDKQELTGPGGGPIEIVFTKSPEAD
jgi:phage terminase small subunit